MRLLLLMLATILFAAPSLAKEPIRSFDCMVEEVVDGDTLHCAVKNSGGTHAKIRLYGIDAPESDHFTKHGKLTKPGQPYGNEAATALRNLVTPTGIIQVDVMDVDRYKRLVSVIKRGELNINRRMVEEGWAWAYRQYLDRPHASEYIKAEEQARARKLGLWKQNNPQPPWEFRKLQRGKKFD